MIKVMIRVGLGSASCRGSGLGLGSRVRVRVRVQGYVVVMNVRPTPARCNVAGKFSGGFRNRFNGR